jgi:hypothetical protein
LARDISFCSAEKILFFYPIPDRPQLEEPARWHMMMERSRDCIVIMDTSNYAVLDVNPAFAEMPG